MNDTLKELLKTSLYLLGLLLLALFIVTFIGQRTIVDGTSMCDTLSDKDNLIVDKITYRFRNPERFEVIVFPYQKEKDDDTGSVTMTLPLFAYWKFGKGVVSSFTSNLGAWTYTFRRSAEGKKFFQNVWNNLLPEFASHDQIQFSYETRGVTSDIHIYAADTDTNA